MVRDAMEGVDAVVHLAGAAVELLHLPLPAQHPRRQVLGRVVEEAVGGEVVFEARK